MLADYGGGQTVQPADAGALAQAIRQLTTPEALTDLHQSLQKKKDRYRWAAFADQLFAWLKQGRDEG